jgi:LuxR family maltose regulon positive regulatory protein
MFQRTIKIAFLLLILASIVLVVAAHAQAATQYLYEALQMALAAQLVLLALSAVVSLSGLRLLIERRERNVELLALTLHHSASDRDTKGRLLPLVTVDPMMAEFEQHGETRDFNMVTAAELDEGLALNRATTTYTPQANWTVIEPLSQRELEVVNLIADGLSNKQIADRLILSVGTVKWHTSQIYYKLGVQNRVQAIRRTQQLNLLSKYVVHNRSINDERTIRR